MTKKAKPHITGMILTLCISLSWFSFSALAQQGETQVQQLVESGTITPQQAQEAIEAVEKGQISPEALDQLQREGRLGNLTPAEIEAGKKLLEQQEEAPQPAEAVKEEEEKVYREPVTLKARVKIEKDRVVLPGGETKDVDGKVTFKTEDLIAQNVELDFGTLIRFKEQKYVVIHIQESSEVGEEFLLTRVFLKGE